MVLPSKKSLVLLATIDLGARNAPAIHVLSLARELLTLGYEITIIAPRYKGALPAVLPDGVKLDLTPNISRWRLPNTLNALVQIPYLVRHRKKAFYLRSSPLSLFIILFAKLLGNTPVLIEVNGWFSDEFKALGAGRAVMAIADFMQLNEARLADRISVVTNGLYEILKSQGIDHKKIRVIENGADTSVFVPVKRQEGLTRLSLNEDVHYMAFIGNLWPPVDMEIVFQALHKLRNRDKHIELLIVGDGRSVGEFRKLAKMHGVDARVHFLGSLDQSDLKYVLGAADIAIAPLHAERNERIGVSPLKVYEYAASGTPVIATYLPGISRLSDEPWIYLVSPGDIQAWCKAIEDLLAIDNRDILSKAARSLAEREFDWSKRALQVEQLLENELG